MLTQTTILVINTTKYFVVKIIGIILFDVVFIIIIIYHQ